MRATSRHLLLVGAVAGVLFGTASLRAQEDDEPEANCGEPITQYEMNVCAARDYEVADKALNAQWPKTRKLAAEWDKQLEEYGTSPGAEKALLKAQRAWIDYRDGQCEAEGFGVRGGSMEPLIVSSCLTVLTQKRTEELKQLTDTYGN